MKPSGGSRQAASPIGIDVIALDRILRSHRRWPGQLEGRVLGPAERAQLPHGGHRPLALAARLACKEAALKTCGGRWAGFAWHCITLGAEEDGEIAGVLPGLELPGPILDRGSFGVSLATPREVMQARAVWAWTGRFVVGLVVREERRLASALAIYADVRDAEDLLGPFRLEQVFSAAERHELARSGSVATWAGRLAAKRSVVTLLGLEATSTSLRSVTVGRVHTGRPIVLQAQAASCAPIASGQIGVTITHDAGVALAVAWGSDSALGCASTCG